MDIETGGMNTRRVVDIDRKIMLIQQSTRTLFRVFFPIHDWLRLHSTYYYLWSTYRFSRVVHWTALFLFICSLPAFYFSAFNEPVRPEAAADYICIFDGSTNNNWSDPTNWDAGAGCNGQYPGQSSNTVYDVIIPTSKTVSLDIADINLNNDTNSLLGNLDITGSLTTNNNSITFGSIGINSGGAVTAGSSTITVYGDWSNAGTFTAGTSTVSFAKPLAGTQTINSGGTTAATKAFKNLTHSGTGILQVVTNDINIDGIFTNSNGTFDLNTKNMTVAGNFSLSNGTTFSKGGTLTFDGSTAATFEDLNATKQNLGAVSVTKTGASASLTLKTSTGNGMTVDTMTVSANNTFDLNTRGYTFTLANAGNTATVLTVNGDLDAHFMFANASTIVYSATNSGGSINITNINYAKLSFAPSSAQTYVLTGSLVVGATGLSSLTIGANATLNTTSTLPAYNIEADDLTIASGGTFIANSSTITLSGDWNNAGVFNAGISTVKFKFGTTSTLISGGTGDDNDFFYLDADFFKTIQPQINDVKAARIDLTNSATLDMATYNKNLDVTVAMTISSNSVYLTGTGSQTVGLITNNGTITAVDCTGNNLLFAQITGNAVSHPDSCTPPPPVDPNACKISGTYASLTLNNSTGCTTYELIGTTTITNSDGLTMSGVTLAIGTQTLNIAGNLTGYVITIGTGTLNITGSLNGGSIVCDGASNINVGGTWMATFTPSTSTVTFNGSAPQGLVWNYTWYNLIIANPSSVSMTGNQTVLNDLVVRAGEFRLPYYNQWNIMNHSFKNVSIEAGGSMVPEHEVSIAVSGNWSNAGTFTPSTGMFTFNGSGDSIISGATTFNNLTMDASVDGPKTIYFADGKGNTTTVNGTWNMKGSSDKRLTLRSTNHNSPWYFNISGDMTSGSYIDVEDSYSTNDFRITPGSHVINSGNNPGWIFPASQAIQNNPPAATAITNPEAANTPEPSAISKLVDTLQNSPAAKAIANVAEKVTQVTAAIGLIPLVANLIGGIPAALHAVNYGFSLTIEALGIRRRRKSWGRVYDSTTGKGVDTAVIRLYDQKEMMLRGTMITDLKGKYYFSADPGVYAITVSKDGYIFPTEIFAKYGIQSFNKKASRDNTQYVGQPINIDDKTNYLNIDVPMDPVKPNISTMLKIKIFGKDLFNYFIVGLPYIVIPALIVGSVLSIFTAVVRPTDRNIILSVVYVALTAIYILSRYLRAARAGMVMNKTDKKPIQGVMISLFEKEHNNLKETRITDRYGKFSINAPKGHYYMKAQKSGYTFTISGKDDKEVNLKEAGYIREVFEGQKK